MPEYTPTTEEVRSNMALGVAMAAYVVPEETHSGNVDWPIPGYRENAKTAFDRWLKAHDREVAAQTLEAVAHEWGNKTWLSVLVSSLVARAAALRSGTEGSTDV